MSNTRIQFKRTTISGRLPNTTSSSNTSFIDAGEFAVNLTDQKVVSSNGTVTFEIGANLSSLNVASTIAVGSATINSTIYSATANNSNNLNGQAASYYTNATNISTGTLPYAQLPANVVIWSNTTSFTAQQNFNNNTKLGFVANSGAASNVSYFILQTDNNFVFYNTATDGSARAVWSIFTNSNTSSFTFSVPAKFNSAVLDGAGSNGTSGYVLTSNGTGVNWAAPASGSFSNGTSYTWSATQTHTANIALTSNTTSLMLGGAADNNWKLGRNIATYTKAYYTNNSMDFLIGSSSLEGITFGNIANTSFIETGAAGTWFRANVSIGNVAWSSAMLTVGGAANVSGNLSVGTTTSNVVTSILSNSQIVPSGNFTSNATMLVSGAGGNYLAIGQSTTFAQWIQSGYNGVTPTYYPILLNPLGGNVAIGSTSSPDSTLKVTGTANITGVTAHGANVTMSTTATVLQLGNSTISVALSANGSNGTSGQVLSSNGTSVYWATASGGATLTANSTDTQTFYLPMANTTSGSWSNGVVSTTKLYFVPSTGTLNATIFNSLSDRSVKENISTIPNALDIVRNLDGVSFNWKDNGDKSYGVIAQEVEKIIPELVSNADPKSVNYSGIIAFLINAIKELDKEVQKNKCCGSCGCKK